MTQLLLHSFCIVEVRVFGVKVLQYLVEPAGNSLAVQWNKLVLQGHSSVKALCLMSCKQLKQTESKGTLVASEFSLFYL